MTNELFDFNDWLDGIETPAEGVTVYQKPGLIGRLAKLQETIDELPPNKEQTIGEVSPQAEVERLRREIAASKTVWYISPLTREDEQAVEEAYPEPELGIKFEEKPPRLADRATKEQTDAFLAAWGSFKELQKAWEVENADVIEEFQRKIQQVALDRGATRIAMSVNYIETFDTNGVPTLRKVSLSADDVKAAERKLGQAQMGLLVEALERVSTKVQEPDPFESPAS